MENKKMTKKQMFEIMKGYVGDNQDLIDFIDHEIELLSRKASRSTETKTQKENVAIKDMLLEEIIKIGKPITISDLMEQSSVVANYVLENGSKLSNQKISALFKQMVDNDKTLVKVIDKKKSYFSVAE